MSDATLLRAETHASNRGAVACRCQNGCVQQTRTERAVAVGGLVAIVVLSALVLVAWRDYHEAPAAHSQALDVRTAPVRRRPVPAVVPVARPKPKQAARTARVALGAVGGSCWLLIRAGSDSGPTLYEGVLAQGAHLAFTRRRLWIRIGAGENLAMTVNGVRVDNLPGGVTNVVATRGGVRPS